MSPVAATRIVQRRLERLLGAAGMHRDHRSPCNDSMRACLGEWANIREARTAQIRSRCQTTFEYKQKFVMDPNGFVNSHANIFADPQIDSRPKV
jgi:hypothetical protein